MLIFLQILREEYIARLENVRQELERRTEQVIITFHHF